MFADDEVSRAESEVGVAPEPATLKAQWWATVEQVLSEATLTLPDPNAWSHSGGRRGEHSEHLGYVLAEMQFLQRAYPNSEW
jgi:ring-1,2-phenylacetyl-CoA epoxidase subunit PaaC